MTGLADIASIVTGGATCAALVFAGLELRQSRARDRRNRQVEIEGVAVSWSPPEVPRGPQDPEGRSRWILEFTAYNPGSCPSATSVSQSTLRWMSSAFITTATSIPRQERWSWRRRYWQEERSGPGVAHCG
jgi:hypothetical protein